MTIETEIQIAIKTARGAALHRGVMNYETEAIAAFVRADPAVSALLECPDGKEFIWQWLIDLLIDKEIDDQVKQENAAEWEKLEAAEAEVHWAADRGMDALKKAIKHIPD